MTMKLREMFASSMIFRFKATTQRRRNADCHDAVASLQTEDPTVASQPSSRSFIRDMSRKQVQFTNNHPEIVFVPNRHELDANEIWWMPTELRQGQKESEKLMNAFQSLVETCPSLLPTGWERQACQDVHGIVKATQTILCQRKGSDKQQILAAQKLHDCLSRATNLRSLERCLMAQKSNDIIQRHTRIVVKHGKYNDKTVAHKAIASSQGCVYLGHILGNFDAMQAKACWE